MNKTRLCLAVGLVLGLGWPVQAKWAPAQGPLVTRWAKDVSPERAHPEYPRPQLVRDEWQNLNGLWQFAFGKESEEPPLDKVWPGQILVPFPVESALSGVMKPVTRVWYRRTFAIPESWAGRHTLLHFGAVNWEAAVWLNGKKLGTHRGGYDGFHYDVTEVLKPRGEQELIVGVWNPADAGQQPRGKQVRSPGGIFYTASTGIWQTVWLEPVAATSIESIKITPDVDQNRVRINVKCRGVTRDHALLIAIKGTQTSVEALTESFGQDFDVPIAGRHLWSPTSPYLYDVQFEVRHKNGTVDRVRSYFGLRKIAVGKDDKGVTRLLLNGKPLFQLGLLDQGFWPDGLYTAPTDEALRHDIEVTKALGFNLARKHVKVEPERWYYWCDKLGLLVWQDMPSGDKGVAPDKGEMTRTPESAQTYETELHRMVEGRSNHPCIVMWVPFNEGWGQFDTARITELIKKKDPTRLVNCASGWNDMGVGDVRDIHVYPGPGSPKPESKRAAVLGEFGGLGLRIEGHGWSNKTWGYQGTRDRTDLTRKYEKLLRRIWELEKDPGLSAAIYTQTTDVETEGNGLLTYDRAIIKVDKGRTAAVNQGDLSHVPRVQVIVPTSQKEGLLWRYTSMQPNQNWIKADFDDTSWKEGPGGLGTQATPGAVVRTEWKTSDIWIRRSFVLPKIDSKDVVLQMHHDEDAEVYLNGVLAARVSGYTTNYEEVPILPDAMAVLKPGKNVLAVHCHQTFGGQYIDVGIGALIAPQRSSQTAK